MTAHRHPQDERLHSLDPDLRMFFQEIKDRVIRTETRLTRFIKAHGYDPGGEKPRWMDSGELHVPTPNISLSEMVAAVPAHYPREHEVLVYCGGDFLLAFTRD